MGRGSWAGPDLRQAKVRPDVKFGGGGRCQHLVGTHE